MTNKPGASSREQTGVVAAGTFTIQPVNGSVTAPIPTSTAMGHGQISASRGSLGQLQGGFAGIKPKTTRRKPPERKEKTMNRPSTQNQTSCTTLLKPALAV